MLTINICVLVWLLLGKIIHSQCELSYQNMKEPQNEGGKNRIAIWPIDVLLEVFEFSLPIWVTFQFVWNSVMRDIPIWVIFLFKWPSNFSDI